MRSSLNAPRRGFAGLEQWRKNQVAVTASGACLFFGYTLVMPFITIYVRDLGIQSTGAIAFWSGLLLSISPLMAAFAGTFWGRIGDRYGMKIMATRATAVNCVCWLAMGLAQNVWHLLILRALLGVFGGFSNVSAALVTQLAPREKAGSVIGTLQSVQILSAAVGPVVGGWLAHVIGIRNTFFVTGIVALGSLISIIVLYRDSDSAKEGMASGTEEPRADRSFMRRPEFVTTLLILFFVNMADRTFGPILPLFLEELGTPSQRLAAVAGILISLAAAGESLSAWLSGKLASRFRLRHLIMGRLVLSVVALVPMVFVQSTATFSVLRIALALLAGGMLTLALTEASHIIPQEHRGAGFGLLSGTSMLGGAAGPLLSGMIAGYGIRHVFWVNCLVYLLMAWFVYRYVKD